MCRFLFLLIFVLFIGYALYIIGLIWVFSFAAPPKAVALAEEAQKAMGEENYLLAIEKFDAALALCPRIDSWKRKRDSALKILMSKPAIPDSFEYAKDSLGKPDRTIISRYIGEESIVVIPDGVKVIDDWAFAGHASLRSVVISEGVTTIKPRAFKDCPNLTICAPKGSAAERFAKDLEIPFKEK